MRMAAMDYVNPAFSAMRTWSGFKSIIPGCSMTPTNPLMTHNRERGPQMPHAQNTQNQVLPSVLSNISVTNMPTTPEAMDAMLVNLVQEFSLQLAAWRGCKLTGIKLEMEPLQ